MWWVLVGTVLQSLMPQAPVRDAAPPKQGTAIIRGRVTDKDSGLPVPRIVVRLSDEVFTENPLSATTGEDGRYVLTGVPAGSHAVIAMMPQYRTLYLPQAYGQPRPMDPMDPMGDILQRAARISIADGETREGIDIQLTRALGIGGRVVNEYGEPMSNVRVQLESASGQVYATGWIRETDDRGEFRLFGLRPGSYRVCAEPERFAPGPTRSAGEAPQKSCYPGPDETDGLLLSSADPLDIEIRLRSGRTFSISGVILDSSGAPVEGADATILTSHSSFGAPTQPGGRFSFRGMAPGEYQVLATVRRWSDPLDKRERQIGVVPVRVETADVEGVTVPLARGARVTGRLIADDASLPPRTQVRVSSLLEEVYGHNRPGPDPVALASEGATFELAELFGPVRFYVGDLPSGWAVKTIRYLDRDITNQPTEFPAGTTQAIEIVVTNRAAMLSGTVSDESGARTSSRAAVVLIPADFTGDWSPLVPVVPTTSDDTFKLPGLRAGEYWIAAVDTGQLFLLINSAGKNLKGRVLKVAQRIQLSEGEHRTIDLRIVKLPEDR